MAATTTDLTAEQLRRRDDLTQRLFDSTVATLEMFSIHLGRRLGLYDTLAAAGPLRPPELARQAGIDQRYAREWLEQQAVAGFLDVADATAEPDERRFALPPGHAEALTQVVDPAHLAPFASMVVGIGGALPGVVDAYRSGGGVPYTHYGADLRDGQGGINRPAFHHEMRQWLAASDEIHQRLSGSSAARVADVGCGQGFSSIAIARAYPRVRVDGFDLDEASIVDARQQAEAAGVADRVSFVAGNAADLAGIGGYDLVCMFEALHDMARPAEALRATAEMVAPGGSILLVDERVADTFTAPGDVVERMMYGWSVTHCLPAAKAEDPAATTGTVLRAGMVVRLAQQAGIGRVEQLPIENELFRFYRLVP